jgi:hypothetical protein
MIGALHWKPLIERLAQNLVEESERAKLRSTAQRNDLLPGLTRHQH